MSFPARVLALAKQLITWGLLGAVIVGAYAWLHHHEKEDPAADRTRTAKVIPVTVEPLTLRPVQQSIQVTGDLHGFEEISLTLKVEGQVRAIYKDMNDIVRPGDVLLELDPRDYELAAEQARLALEIELARLQPGLKAVPGKEFDLFKTTAVQEAVAREEEASRDHARNVDLHIRKSISQEALDRSRAALTVAQARKRQAVIEAERTLIEARLKKSLLDSALENLKHTRLVLDSEVRKLTPVSLNKSDQAMDEEYYVKERHVELMERVRVGPGAPVVFKLVKVRPLKLKVSVPERFSQDIQVGQKAQVRVASHPGELFPGEIVRISPSDNPVSRTFEVEIHLPNEKRKLRPGTFAQVSLLTRVDPEVPMVPEEAVVRFAGVTKVFVLEKDAAGTERAQAIPVRTGADLEVISGDRRQVWVEVIGPVPEGARVITSGQTQLADGTPVRLRK